ncbi:hypothetical protein NUSPORA_01126 [Nucleospora cyclopteri]
MSVNSKDKRDFYYFQAKQMDYRARSVFKLQHIEEKYKIFENCRTVVDLCAAPGSWSQLLSRSNKFNKIIAIDLQEMDPIENVDIIKEDIISEKCIKEIQKRINSSNFDLIDLVVCDGAPDVTGFHDMDLYLQMDILKAALAIVTKVGKPGCNFVGKCFRGEFTSYIVQHFRKFFEQVIITKPRSSRGNSIECFIVAKNYKKCNFSPWIIDFNVNYEAIECETCGYPRLKKGDQIYEFTNDPDFTVEEVIKNDNYKNLKPINPPYKEAVESRKLNK